jgi:hypothetical protein
MLTQALGSTTTDTVRGKALYLLILVAALHFIYPITINPSGPLPLIIYNVLYTGMLLIGIFMARDSRRHLWVTVITAMVYFAFSLWYAFDPTDRWHLIVTYLALIPFQATITLILLRYVFGAQRINRDVLYAAITVYLLLAAVFVPIYGLASALSPAAFVDNAAPSATVSWQQLIYYSLTTLTTTGYGDILPVSPWVRALANAEMVIGVLYLAILMARLVSLYSHEDEGAPIAP